MRIYKYILLIAAIIFPIILLCFYYTYYDPAENTWVNQCTIHTFTGLDCPGCGGQRSLQLLLHRHFLDALRYNALFVLGIPVIAYLYYIIIQVYILGNQKYLTSPFFSSQFAFIFLGVLVLFFILRNIPIVPFSYLAPL